MPQRGSLENTIPLRMHMYTPEKSSPGFKVMKKQNIFTQFSTIKLRNNVALQERIPSIALSQQSLLAHRANHYGIVVA